MRKKALTPLLLTLAVVLVMTSGCNWTQRGALTGGAIGSTIGGFWGYNASNSLNAYQTATMGGAAGALAGGLVGDQLDLAESRQSDRELDNLRAQLSTREAELAELQAGNDPRVVELSEQSRQLQNQIEALAMQNQSLNSSVESLASEKGALAQKKADIEAELALIEQAREDALANATSLIDQNAAMAERMAALEHESVVLRQEIATKEASLDTLQTAVREKASTVDDMRRQLADMNVQLEETNRGLTLTILDQLLFSAGQADLSPEGKALIARVGEIIQSRFPGREIIVEGHTDNQPIRYSKWASNWELGSARALAVVHSMVREHGFNPTRISAMSFGEFRPAADNSTAEGRRMNRRSVIVILPEKAGFHKQVASVGTQ